MEIIESLKKIDKVFEGVDGIIIPGGFGYRGIEGKILAAEYARTSSTPYLGICLGLQIAIIEFYKLNSSKRKAYTFKHFKNGDVGRATIYRWLEKFGKKKWKL